MCLRYRGARRKVAGRGRGDEKDRMPIPDSDVDDEQARNVDVVVILRDDRHAERDRRRAAGPSAWRARRRST